DTERSTTLFQVVYEDAALLAINKPAGLVCHPTKGDAYSSLVNRVRIYLKTETEDSSGWHLVNRLDRETSGIVLVAKDDTTAREIPKIWGSRAVEKSYLAVVHGWPELDSGTINAPTGKDEKSIVAI